VSRSNWFDAPAPETAENLRLMQRIDQEYTAHPFLGSRGMTAWLIEQGEEVNRKRVPRLMGVEAIYPKPKLSAGARTCTCGDAKRCPPLQQAGQSGNQGKGHGQDGRRACSYGWLIVVSTMGFTGVVPLSREREVKS